MEWKAHTEGFFPSSWAYTWTGHCPPFCSCTRWWCSRPAGGNSAASSRCVTSPSASLSPPAWTAGQRLPGHLKHHIRHGENVGRLYYRYGFWYHTRRKGTIVWSHITELHFLRTEWCQRVTAIWLSKCKSFFFFFTHKIDSPSNKAMMAFWRISIFKKNPPADHKWVYSMVYIQYTQTSV